MLNHLYFSRKTSHSVSTIDSHSWMVFVRRGGPVRCGVFSGISGLCPLDASSSSTVWQPKMSLDTARCHVGARSPWLRNTALKWFGLICIIILTLIFAVNKKDLLYNFSSFLLIKFQLYFKMVITKRLTIKFNKNSKYNEIIFVTYIYRKKGSDSNVRLSIDCILLQDKSLGKVKENIASISY